MRTCIRKSVKAAAPADAVTVLRSGGLLLVDNSLRRGRDSSERSIAQIAVRRMNYQAHQHRAQQPRDKASRCCNRAIQAINDNRSLECKSAILGQDSHLEKKGRSAIQHSARDHKRLGSCAVVRVFGLTVFLSRFT